MHQPPDDSSAVRQAQWLRDAYLDRGASVGEADLEARVSASMRDAQGWGSVDAFRRSLAAEGVVVGDVRPEGEDAVIDVQTAEGLRLERVVRLGPDGRLASIVTRLAGGASMTMVSAAAWRAAHVALDDPVILDDSAAGLLVGDASPYQLEAVRAGAYGTDGLHYRWNMVARTRFAEDTFAALRATSGTRQYVLLGAGLDTFALRNPFGDTVVFEVDMPRSQAWKRDRLAQTGIDTPDNVRYVTCDFEEQDFVDRLVGAGFDLDRPAVAAWLGVSYYLTEEAIRATLERVAAWPAGSAIVFDYALSERRWGEFDGFDADGMRAVVEAVAAAGEPFLSMFEDDELIELCRSCGFGEVELLGPEEIRSRFMPGRTSATPGPDPVLRLACAYVR